MLKLIDLSKQYKKGEPALKHINLEIPAGQILALIGPSGAGKSTLIRCINRLVEPSAGRVLLSETDITGLSSRKLRKARQRMAMIFQEYALIERLSVMENVLSGQLGSVNFLRSFFRRFPTQVIDDAFDLLRRVGLEAHVDKRADELSGGQRQRVGIARALLQHPELLLVDEPTASLDPRTSIQIMRLICDLCNEHNLSAIINIHDVTLAKQFVSRVVGLREGSLVFDGSPSELTADVLTDIYGEEDWDQAGHRHAEDRGANTEIVQTSEQLHGLSG